VLQAYLCYNGVISALIRLVLSCPGCKVVYAFCFSFFLLVLVLFPPVYLQSGNNSSFVTISMSLVDICVSKVLSSGLGVVGEGYAILVTADKG
jgi:hypothetical protein